MPCLDGDTSEGTTPHTVFDELAPALEGFALGLEDCGYFFPLGYDAGIVDAAMGLDPSEEVDGLFGATNFG